jgi:hypothetical protein
MQITPGPIAEVFGFTDIKSDGHGLNIKGLANFFPPEGKVFEVCYWMEDLVVLVLTYK